MYHAKNGRICDTDYVRFGNGEKILVILPGLGDGLRTVKGTALPLAAAYRAFAKSHTVYAFSRKDTLPEGYSTREMARDLRESMDALGIECADVLGVSMGGMIAQWLAIDHGEKVNNLVLTVTSAAPNPILLEAVDEWVECARRGDHAALMESNLRRIYSETYYRKNKWMIPLTGLLTKPKSYDRFLLLAAACKTHHAAAELANISARTLVMGGEKDLSLGGDASRELAAAIGGAKLKMYDDLGHGLYDEAKDFQQTVLEFLLTTD